MDMFDGKTAIVTGGASGIGQAIAQALAARGASVVIADILEDAAQDVAREIIARGGQARAMACNVTDAESVARVVKDTVAEYGRLDFMFNNAGIAVLAEIKDTTLDAWYKTFDVNLRGVVHGIRASFPVMIDQGHGRIINTASMTGLMPAPGMGAYVASKHAIVGLTNTLRAEARNYGVKAHVVCPGIIATKMQANMIATPRMQRLREIAMKRPGKRMQAYPADRCANDILAGIARDEPIITVGPNRKPHRKPQWWLYRLLMGFVIDRCAVEYEKALGWLDDYSQRTDRETQASTQPLQN